MSRGLMRHDSGSILSSHKESNGARVIRETASPRWDVIGFGAIAVDDLLYVERYPAVNSKTVILEERRQGGGLTGTALVAAARLGATAAYAGVLGDDDLSRYTLRELEREGVDCSLCLSQAGAKPLHSRIIVERDSGLRSILVSHAGFCERQPEQISVELVQSARVLFVDHVAIEAGLRAAELARAGGIPVVGDIERTMHPRTLDLVALIDHLIVSIEFARRVTSENAPEACALALARGERVCSAVTAGEQGCWYSVRGGAVRHVPAFRVPVVDTTGCGDVFHGAYAASLAQGYEIHEALVRASAAAALKATQPGGRAGIPTRAALERFLATCAARA